MLAEFAAKWCTGKEAKKQLAFVKGMARVG